MIKITDYLQQDANDLICKMGCTLKFLLSEYKEGSTITIEENKIWVAGLIAEIAFVDETRFDLVLDYSCILNATNKTGQDGVVYLHFKNGETILGVDTDASQIKEQLRILEKLLGGRGVVKDVPHLLKQVLRIYSKESSMDLVHLEVLLSNCLRDSTNEQLPARLAKEWDPQLMNIKNVVFASGFYNGLAFENINNAISQGLINPELKNLPPSIIEQVLTGTVIQGKKGKR